MEEIERYRGAMLGLAIGDSLGTALEFKAPGSFEPVTGIIGGGPFNLSAGEWTDDTSMALCLAESLIETNGFHPSDQMDRYIRWQEQGHLSHSGSCFDIGNTVSSALEKYKQSNDPFSGSTASESAGNGSLMRLVPVPLFFSQIPATAIQLSGESSRTTHGVDKAVDACRYFAGLIVGAINGVDKKDLLVEKYCPIQDYWQNNPLTNAIDQIASGSFKRKEPPEIKGTGYVVKSLEAALWAFHKAANFEEGCLLAVNLGDDADTTGAIYGQLAGAYWGESGIPSDWLNQLAWRSKIIEFADELFILSRLRG
jgi:ADP-ribosyl-[dinitrogen reductase] hydrolase